MYLYFTSLKKMCFKRKSLEISISEICWFYSKTKGIIFIQKQRVFLWKKFGCEDECVFKDDRNKKTIS